LFEGKTVGELGMVNKVGDKKFVRSPIRTNKNNIV